MNSNKNLNDKFNNKRVVTNIINDLKNFIQKCFICDTMLKICKK